MIIHNIRNVQRQAETLRSLGRRCILDFQLEQLEKGVVALKHSSVLVVPQAVTYYHCFCIYRLKCSKAIYK